MASILILSEKGDGIPLALRLADEGHIVKLWIKRAEAKTLLEGYKNPSKVSNPKVMLDQYDLILSDTSGLGQLCDELVEKGKAVIGGGSFNDRLMTDQKYQTKVIKTLTKMNPEVGEGIEVMTEGWFNGKEWVRPFNHSFLMIRLMPGDIGPPTPCMGNVVWPTNGNKLTAEIEPLSQLLEKVNYIGPISVCCVINDQEIYFKRFTTSFNYDVILAWFELIQLSLFDYFYNLINQRKQDVPFYDEFAIGVRLSVPPYPYEGKLITVKIPVLEEAKKHVWLNESNNIAGCVTARGQTIRECQRRAYRTIKNMPMDSSVQYRNDIGQGVEELKEKLKGQGWL